MSLIAQRWPSRWAVALALLLAGFTPLAARANVANGQRLARQWCASCHVIDRGPATVPQGPWTFRAMAKNLDRGRMRTFLSHPHGSMPDLTLTRAEIADLIAYIASLR